MVSTTASYWYLFHEEEARTGFYYYNYYLQTYPSCFLFTSAPPGADCGARAS